MNQLNRRQFLTIASGTIVSTAVTCRLLAQQAATAPAATRPHPSSDFPTIALGRPQRTVPRLGFGAYPISTLKTDDEAVAVLRRAISAGVRYIDTAPSYGNGKSEQRIGLALAACGLARQDFFIATKTLHRDATSARRELEQSLTRLKLDYVDSVQCHEVHDDVASLFGENSVIAALEKAREEGLIKNIGVTGHRDPRWLIDAIKRYPFATALVPINPLDKQRLSFIRDFLPVAIEKNVAVIAMKIYAGGHLVQDGPLTAAECVHYALSQPGVAVAVPGCQSAAHVDEALAAMQDFTPLSAESQADLERRAGQHQGKDSEWYKD